MSDNDQSETEAPAFGAVLLAWRSGRPHAARFLPDEVQLATKAAKLMGFHVLMLDSGEKIEAAQDVVPGRIFSSGKAFCPFTKQSTFERLASLAGIDLHEDLQSQALSEETFEPIELIPAEPRLPPSWGEIGPGCLCLASEGQGHAWYEVNVLAHTPEGWIVAWRDFQDLDNFVRRSDQLALLPLSPSEPVEQAST